LRNGRRRCELCGRKIRKGRGGEERQPTLDSEPKSESKLETKVEEKIDFERKWALHGLTAIRIVHLTHILAKLLVEELAHVYRFVMTIVETVRS